MALPATIKGHSGFFTPVNKSKYKGNIDRIIWRSTWEKHVMDTLDSNPNVLQWSSEQIAIAYESPVDGMTHRYFPDMWAKLKRDNGTIVEVLIEVKPDKQTKPPTKGARRSKKFLVESATFLVNEAKWAAARAYCRAKGWEFVIMTENKIFK